MKGAILVPYRDRAEHLAQFIPRMRKYAPEMDIYVIEQMGEQQAFNRGKLLNVGVLELNNTRPDISYFCFHDVDMLPISADYSFVGQPTHLARQVSQFGYKLPYNEYFGGVTMIPNDFFHHVNGFPNNLWGWGAEDDLLYRSFINRGVQVNRKNCSFKSLDHVRDVDPNKYKHNLDILNAGRDFTDGLTSCEYTCYHTQMDGYTIIKAKI